MDLYRLNQSESPGEAAAEAYLEERRRLRRLIRETSDYEARRELNREIRQANQAAFERFVVEWMQWAVEPENSPTAKLLSFLQNIFVVARQKVNDTDALVEHQRILREGSQGNFPDLCKAVSRSPAMIRYLDLNLSTRERPNENFARELMELFTLGEGNYTEADVYEAARAFTGYRTNARGRFFLSSEAHDHGPKQIFGQTARFDGDAVIDLIFEQPASERFFVREFLKTFLSSELPPEPYIEALGNRWRFYKFSIPDLVSTVFQSRIFFDTRFRGTLIKSPTAFYLGLCQDLLLHPPPFPRRLLNELRSMGQDFQNPPNVRGWVGGSAWISASTVSARRQLVDTLFRPINEDRLNADDKAALDQARKQGKTPIQVQRERLQQIASVDRTLLAEHLSGYFLSIPPSPEFIATLESLLENSSEQNVRQVVRSVIVAMLQSPQYNLT